MSKPKYIGVDLVMFKKFLRFFHLPETTEDELLFDAYNDAIDVLNIHQQAFENMPFSPLEHGRLILYLTSDYRYRLKGLSYEEKVAKMDEETFRAIFINAVIDKYGSLSYFKYEEGRYVTPFSMEISTINVYVNFILLKLKDMELPDADYQLVRELLRKAFQMCQTITELLVSGFEKEALSSWRSLHELEATISLLRTREIVAVYQQHFLYNAAFNGRMSKEEGDIYFGQMKTELKSIGLKSKDIRRFIEYGWIRIHPDFDINVHKFNFRDGVEALSGLTDARETYQVASEVAHSSPLMLFTDRQYFLRLALISLYSSFTTIEKLFCEIYRQFTDENEFAVYQVIRGMYLKDIELVNNRLTATK